MPFALKVAQDQNMIHVAYMVCRIVIHVYTWRNILKGIPQGIYSPNPSGIVNVAIYLYSVCEQLLGYIHVFYIYV